MRKVKNVNEFDELWRQIPYASTYNRFHDSDYWEKRTAVLVRGVLNDRDSHMYKRNNTSDILLVDKYIEVKTASYKKVKGNTYGFQFSHIRGKNADIIILIGICICDDIYHHWIADYKELLQNINKDGYLYLYCPRRNYKSKSETSGCVQPMVEHRINQWIVEWENCYHGQRSLPTSEMEISNRKKYYSHRSK